jgi:hypothetical protein
MIIRRKPEPVRLQFFYAWQVALGMPLWRLMEATELCDAVIYNAARARPISKATARLLSIALEVPLDLLMRVGPDHPDAVEIVRARSAELRLELAVRSAELSARNIIFARKTKTAVPPAGQAVTTP